MRNTLSVCATVLVITACSDASADRSTVERSDSAGTEVVVTRGPDVPLEWSFDPVLVLGGTDEGPEAFFHIGDDFVGTDRDGNVYVLDGGNHRIVVFGLRGELLRTMGGKGGGPGEFERPGSFAVDPDGSVRLFDWAKRAFIGWDPGGDLLPSEPVVGRYAGGRVIRTTTGRTVLTLDSLDLETASSHKRLVSIRGGDTVVAMTHSAGGFERRDFGCVTFSGFPSLFAPELVWTASGDRVIASDGPEYALDVIEDGSVVASIRRDVPMRTVSESMAMQQVGETMKVSFGGVGGCEIPAARAVQVRGYAPFIQSVEALAVAPDGDIWARRGRVRGEEPIIDIFDSTGAYTGTLPQGSPWPVAFAPPGAVVALEKDELDLQRVIVYRVIRQP